MRGFWRLEDIFLRDALIPQKVFAKSGGKISKRKNFAAQ
jgi:hypothetical protein